MSPDATLGTTTTATKEAMRTTTAMTTATTKAMRTTWVPTIWYVKYVDVRKTTMRTIQKTAGDVDNDGQMTFLDGAVVVVVIVVVFVMVVVVPPPPVPTTTMTTTTTTMTKTLWTL